MKKKSNTVGRNITIRKDQDAFLKAHKDDFNLSKDVRKMIDKEMRKWGKEHGE